MPEPQEGCDCYDCVIARGRLSRKKTGAKLNNRPAAPAGRQTGAVIKWYNRRFGYGFVKAGSADLFFHHSVVSAEGFSSKSKLKKGQKVLIKYKQEILKDKKVYRCTKVTIQ